jgi:hypothetical protein
MLDSTYTCFDQQLLTCFMQRVNLTVFYQFIYQPIHVDGTWKTLS